MEPVEGNASDVVRKMSRRDSRDPGADGNPKEHRKLLSTPRSQSKVGYFSDIDFKKFYTKTSGQDRRLEEVQAVYKQAMAQSLYGLTPINPKEDGISQNGFEETQMVGLEKILRHRIQIRGYYLYFISSFLWFLVYVCSLYLEKVDVQVSCAITRSALNTVVFDVFNVGAGSYGYTDSKLGTVNYLQSQQEILDWINSSILSRVFVDAICGDGICSDTEFPGVGRFGCSADCGSFQNVTAVTIDLTSFMRSKPIINLNKWDISHVIPSMRADARFRWNIYSESLGDYVFATDQEEGQVTVDLLDGVYWFELYQTGQSSLNISAEDMYLNGYIVAETVPKREARTAYKYGDYREFLSSSVAMMDAMYDYCYSSDIPRNLDGSEDVECRTFFDKSFGVRALSGYGLSGTITRKNGNEPPVDIVTVPYCSVFPNGSLGLGGMRRVWEGIEIVNEWVTTGEQGGADVNLPIMMNAEIPCATGIDQATVNTMFRSLDGQEGRRRRRPPPSEEARGSRGPRRPTNYGSARLSGATAAERRAATSGLRRSVGGSESGPRLRVDVTGPVSSLGGPGYDEGLFWGELRIELAGAEGLSLEGEATIWYSLDNEAPPNCSGIGASMYGGPTFLSGLARQGGIRAVACSGRSPIAAGQSSPMTLTTGPSMTIVISFSEAQGSDLANSTGRVADDVWRALCAMLAIDEFCSERVVVGAPGDGRTVTGTVLAATNAEAGAWRQQMVLNASILEQFLVDGSCVTGLTVADVDVIVPVPRHKLHHVGQFCTSHYDCAAVAPGRVGTNITDTTTEDLAWGSGFCAAYGSRMSDGRAPTCDYCRLYCMIESIDSFDGICPEECGNFFSGKIPACVSATKLQETFSCTDKHRFELRQFTRPNEEVTDPRKAKMSVLRSLTPANNLIGGVILTQHRIPIGTCPAPSTRGMGRFNKVHGVQCADRASRDGSPFGVDPSFAESSTLFDGKHLPEDFYNLTTETFTTGQARANLAGTPYGFYPHQWDSARGTMKNTSLIWGQSVDEFKLYFDGRISSEHAKRLLQYMEDGRFLDESTSRLKVEMITYNAEVRLFATWTFTFDFHRTGDISWDYALQVVNVDHQDSPLHSWVSGLSLFLLTWHLALELRQIYAYFVSMRIWQYFLSLFNLVDWLNFGIQVLAWHYWYVIRSKILAFEMDENSYVLSDPQATFRPFATDARQEYKLLELIEQISALADLQAYHASFAGISIILFVFKMIASLDFQPKMGLITRTLSRAGSNMIHYLALYSLVFVGYAVVGNLMFGSLYAGMSTLADTCQTLMFFMLAFDPTQFYSQMNHAITHRQGSSIQPGVMEYNVYLWSYMFINSFILMNIFLAILVSAYDDIARQSDGCNGVLTDLREMFTYYAKLALLPATHFVSDDELLTQIRRELHRISGENWGETELNARANTVRDALAPKQAILLGRGVAMEKEQIRGLVDKVIEDKARSEPGLCERLKRRLADWRWPSLLADDSAAAGRRSTPGPAPSVEEGPSAGVSGHGMDAARRRLRRMSSISQSQVALLLTQKHAAVDDLMMRLGVDMRKRNKEMSEEVLRLLQIEGHGSLIRVLSAVEALEGRVEQSDRHLASVARHLLPGSACVAEMEAEEEARVAAAEEAEARAAVAGGGLDPKTVIATLEVTVVSARNLPRMDVLSSCDAYCVAFLNEEGTGEGGLGGEYMQFMSQLKMTRVVRSRSPVWEEVLAFDVTPATRSLVLSVWDRDRLSADDLVGCVELRLEDLLEKGEGREGAVAAVLDGHYPLVHARHAAKLRNSFLRVRTALRRPAGGAPPGPAGRGGPPPAQPPQPPLPSATAQDGASCCVDYLEPGAGE